MISCALVFAADMVSGAGAVASEPKRRWKKEEMVGDGDDDDGRSMRFCKRGEVVLV